MKRILSFLYKHLGINGFLILGIIGAFLGGIFALGNITASIAVYFLIKKRKELSLNQKIIGWILAALWFLLIGILPQIIHQY